MRRNESDYGQTGKEDSEGLKADELREILLTVKGIGPAKAENIMEAVGKALAEKG